MSARLDDLTRRSVLVSSRGNEESRLICQIWRGRDSPPVGSARHDARTARWHGGKRRMSRVFRLGSRLRPPFGVLPPHFDLAAATLHAAPAPAAVLAAVVE